MPNGIARLAGGCANAQSGWVIARISPAERRGPAGSKPAMNAAATDETAGMERHRAVSAADVFHDKIACENEAEGQTYAFCRLGPGVVARLPGLSHQAS